MRTLEECTAEVFRRSEIKIRKRKIRSRASLCCIPLLLCATGLLFWRISPERSTDGAIKVPQGAYYSASIYGIEVKTADASYTITNPVTVEHIWSILNTPQVPESYLERAPEHSDLPTENILTPPANSIQTDSGLNSNATADYQLIFWDGNNQSSTYTLTGNTVVSHSTGAKHLLSDETLIQLLLALEAPLD